MYYTLYTTLKIHHNNPYHNLGPSIREEKMNQPLISGYHTPNKHSHSQASFSEIVKQLPIRTKIGGSCLIAGKFVGVLAIPTVFIPSLHIFGIVLVIIWSGLIFTAITLCTYEHFHNDQGANEKSQIDLIQNLLATNPALRQELRHKLQTEDQSPQVVNQEFPENSFSKVVQLHTK
jgi:hypothetical protein